MACRILRPPSLLHQQPPIHLSVCSVPHFSNRPFSVLNRPPSAYPGHVPLTTLERGALALGSALISYVSPHRHDMVAALSEVTSTPFPLPRLRRLMLAHPTGRRILRTRPRLNSSTLSLSHLQSLPPHTLGATYAAWLAREHVTPDTRSPVRYVDDPELAYVLQRYRECHDFFHAITGLPVWVEGELAVKAFEVANLGLPMAGLALGAVARMKPEQRRRFWGVYGPWGWRNGVGAECMLNVYWEEEMETDVGELRRRLGIEQPPDLREWRKRERDEKRREREAAREMADS